MMSFFVEFDETKVDDEPFGYRLRVSLSIRFVLCCCFCFFIGGEEDCVDDIGRSSNKLFWWSRFKRIDEFVPLDFDIHK